jgi:hypothetical protein
MPGGAAVELEIAIPQFWYVAQVRKWFNDRWQLEPDQKACGRRPQRQGLIGSSSNLALRNPQHFSRETRFLCNQKKTSALFQHYSMEEMCMRKALAILATVATVGATAMTAPAEARGFGFGPGLGIGLAAGALAAGAYGAYAYGPGYGYYGPGYGYYGYGPRYYGYGPAYYRPGPYAYYGGPYYRHRYWRHW